MASNAHNSLISTPPTNCTSNRLGCKSLWLAQRSLCASQSLFVFNSLASLCRNVAAGRDGFAISNSKI